MHSTYLLGFLIAFLDLSLMLSGTLREAGAQCAPTGTPLKTLNSRASGATKIDFQKSSNDSDKRPGSAGSLEYRVNSSCYVFG